MKAFGEGGEGWGAERGGGQMLDMIQVIGGDGTLRVKHVRVFSRFLQFFVPRGYVKDGKVTGMLLLLQQDRQVVQRISSLELVGCEMWQKSRSVELFGVWASIRFIGSKSLR